MPEQKLPKERATQTSLKAWVAIELMTPYFPNWLKNLTSILLKLDKVAKLQGSSLLILHQILMELLTTENMRIIRKTWATKTSSWAMKTAKNLTHGLPARWVSLGGIYSSSFFAWHLCRLCMRIMKSSSNSIKK